MALPLAGIAANMLLGAAIGAVGMGVQSMFGGNDKKATNTSTRSAVPASRGVPAFINNNFVRSDAVSTQQAVQNNPVQTIQVTQPTRRPSPQPRARPETRAQTANRVAQEIQRLPVFTPTAPTVSSKSYSSQRREDVQKTKAGEQMLRNPLAIDRDAASAQITSNLPSIGVSASGTNIAYTGPSPIRKGNSNNARR